MEKLSKSKLRQIIIIKAIAYVLFAAGFILGTVKENMNIFFGFGAVTLVLLAFSTITYWKDYKKRKQGSSDAK